MGTGPTATVVAGCPADQDAGLAVLPRRAEDEDVLVVVGEADLSTAQLLYDELVQSLPAPPRTAVVELGALGFCDLRGLDALRAAAAAARTAGVCLTSRSRAERPHPRRCPAPQPGHVARPLGSARA